MTRFEKAVRRGARWRALFLSAAATSLAVGCSAATDVETGNLESSQEALVTPYDWPQFFGNSQHSGNNTLETQLTAQNVSGLVPLFNKPLPAQCDSAPVVLTGISAGGSVRDLVFVTTQHGDLSAFDARTGVLVWSVLGPTGANFTTSSPVLDPNRAFVYSYGLDGKIHKYAVATGVETVTGGWPAIATLKPQFEKGITSLSLVTTTANANYLSVGFSGYGDFNDYQGHVTTVNLATGGQTVFNANCSDQAVHFVTGGSPDCSTTMSAIWGRSGVVYSAATNRVYATTGNGTFAPAQHLWGDSVIALNPDGTGANGDPLDTYTPPVFQHLQDADLDLGSTSIAILPNSGSKYPHLAIQGGKDNTLRLLNLDNLSNQGGIGHTGGEVWSYTEPLPTLTTTTLAGPMTVAMPVWTNPADSSTWVFVTSNTGGTIKAPDGTTDIPITGGFAAYKLVLDGAGNPSLTRIWQKANPAGTSLIANNVLYRANSNSIVALNPATGAQLWSSTAIGAVHFNSPVVANGVLYIGDRTSATTSQLWAFALPTATLTPLSRAGWVASASSTGGADVPARALDGAGATRFSTGVPEANGQYFQVDMLTPQSFSRVTLDSAASVNDYPRAYQVFVSSDGSNWGTQIASGSGTGALVSVDFAPQTARYLRIVQTGSSTSWWSIAELNVYTGAASPNTATRINTGGPAASPYLVDTGFTGGTTISHANAIDLSAVTNPAPAAVYQTGRSGTFSYTIPGFTAGSSHSVRLHFAETYFSSAGLRKFNVSINGVQLLTNYDIFAQAGAKNKAVVVPFTVAANASGQYVLQFTTVINSGLVSGIEVQ